MSDAPKLFADNLDGLLSDRLDASSALLRTRKREDEQRMYSFINRLSERIDRRVAVDCDDMPVTVTFDVRGEK